MEGTCGLLARRFFVDFTIFLICASPFKWRAFASGLGKSKRGLGGVEASLGRAHFFKASASFVCLILGLSLALSELTYEKTISRGACPIFTL